MESFKKQVDDQAWDIVRIQFSNKVYSQIRDELYDQVRVQVSNPVFFKFGIK